MYVIYNAKYQFHFDYDFLVIEIFDKNKAITSMKLPMYHLYIHSIRYGLNPFFCIHIYHFHGLSEPFHGKTDRGAASIDNKIGENFRKLPSSPP